MRKVTDYITVPDTELDAVTVGLDEPLSTQILVELGATQEDYCLTTQEKSAGLELKKRSEGARGA